MIGVYRRNVNNLLSKVSLRLLEPSLPTSYKVPICPTKFVNSTVRYHFSPQFSRTRKTVQHEFIGSAVGNEQLPIHGKRSQEIRKENLHLLHLSSLLRVKHIDVELRNQACLPM